MKYEEFIDNIIKTRGQWSTEVRYSPRSCERHHIILRCKGGEPKKLSWGRHENVIWLYPEEHFTAHKLLAEENPNDPQVLKAYLMMAFPRNNTKTNRDYEIDAHEYEALRIKWSNYCKEHNFGVDENGHSRNLNHHLSEEQKRHLSEVKKGKKLGPNSPEGKLHKKIAIQKRIKEHPESVRRGHRKGTPITNIETGECFYIKTNTIPEGFRYGLPKHKEHIIKNKEAYREQKSALFSGTNNPMWQKGYKIAGGNNGKATIRYFFKENVFESRKELIEYLLSNNYSITSSAVRIFIKNGISDRLHNAYGEVLDNLRWEYKYED